MKLSSCILPYKNGFFTKSAQAGFHKTRGFCAQQKPLGFGSFLLEQVFPNQHLHQLVPVNLADHTPGTVVIGDIGGIFRQQLADDLVNGILALLR